jgi:signal transduction histidine kinase
MEQLEEANLQLESHSDTLKQLGVIHERQHLARELHDSVTQTLFGIVLITRFTQILMEREPDRVRNQLKQLQTLSQAALSEMRGCISQLHPQKINS